ncbi:adenylate isopentenyltransferase-like [Cucurbita maxima]|uniref:Adenylate isopentenyltransferase-like n=1 Tax=Cucurbita maxima TaxID=3661 RepID=A0A6J1I7X6_CUCMA|nr:adenylate isopentenyltransferase-like [Cucurbita maxima]
MTLSLPFSHSSLHYHHHHHPFPLFLSPSRRFQWPRMLSSLPSDNLLLLLGATGSGKSSLSIDIAARFPSEIINSDKMQLYRGLDVTTNKLPFSDRRGVPHHLLGDFDPLAGEVSAAAFRSQASAVISGVVSRGNLPVVVGGSNSYIHALVTAGLDQDYDVFDGPLNRVSAEFRYRCCFLWVDVSFPVLKQYLSKRVDDMLEAGMVGELAEFYDPEMAETEPRVGLRKAIGVPEFEEFFRRYHPKGREYREGDPLRSGAYEEAVRKIKENTWQLTKRQLGKIGRLRMAGWDLKRVDATAAVVAVLASEAAEKRSEIWEAQVVEPSVKIVKRFIEE